MQVTFKSKKLGKSFSDSTLMAKTFGTQQTRKIRIRMAALTAAQNLGEFWPPYKKSGRCHELTGNRKGQLSIDLDHPYRLIFMPDHDPLPKTSEGGLDWFQVNRIKIIGVEDTHD